MRTSVTRLFGIDFPVFAAAWSIVLASVVGAAIDPPLVRPTPSWLVIPPADARAAAAPLAEWCACSFHPRASECERAFRDNRRPGSSGIGRFQFAGSRCIAAADCAEPSPHDAAVARAETARAGDIGGQGRV